MSSEPIPVFLMVYVRRIHKVCLIDTTVCSEFEHVLCFGLRSRHVSQKPPVCKQRKAISLRSKLLDQNSVHKLISRTRNSTSRSSWYPLTFCDISQSGTVLRLGWGAVPAGNPCGFVNRNTMNRRYQTIVWSILITGLQLWTDSKLELHKNLRSVVRYFAVKLHMIIIPLEGKMQSLNLHAPWKRKRRNYFFACQMAFAPHYL